jgi:hypothetical protein
MSGLLEKGSMKLYRCLKTNPQRFIEIMQCPPCVGTFIFKDVTLQTLLNAGMISLFKFSTLNAVMENDIRTEHGNDAAHVGSVGKN